MDILDVNETVAVNARHGFINLGNDNRGLFRCRFDDVHADTEAQITVIVRKRCLNQGNIDTDSTAIEQCRDIRQGNGCIVCRSLIDRISRVVSNEKGVMPEVTFEFDVGLGGDAKRINMNDFGIKESFRMRFHILGHRLDQILVFAAP